MKCQLAQDCRKRALGIDTQRKVRIDATQIKTSDELLDHLRLMWLVPAMDGLFTGAAGDRRRYLDRMVLAIDPAHGRRVSSFEKSMRSRNKLLGEEMPDQSWLDAIEIQMAEHAVAIASARVEVISLLSSVIIKNNDINSPFSRCIDTFGWLVGNTGQRHGGRAIWKCITPIFCAAQDGWMAQRGARCKVRTEAT